MPTSLLEPAAGREVQLASESLAVGGLEIDAKAGIIRNASLMTRGDAKGHGFVIDDVTLRQTAEGINRRKAGVKARLGHPIFPGDAGTVIGRVSNARSWIARNAISRPPRAACPA